MIDPAPEADSQPERAPTDRTRALRVVGAGLGDAVRAMSGRQAQ